VTSVLVFAILLPALLVPVVPLSCSAAYRFAVRPRCPVVLWSCGPVLGGPFALTALLVAVLTTPSSRRSAEGKLRLHIQLRRLFNQALTPGSE
jgi:hypothetical protein